MLKTPCQHLNNIGSISCVCIVNTPSPGSLLSYSPVWGVVVSRTRQNCIAYPATRMRYYNTDTMLGQCRRWGNVRWWANIKSRCVSGRTLHGRQLGGKHICDVGPTFNQHWFSTASVGFHSCTNTRYSLASLVTSLLTMSPISTVAHPLAPPPPPLNIP